MSVKKTEIDVEKIRTLYETTYTTIRKIAKEMGCSKNIIKDIIKENAITKKVKPVTERERNIKPPLEKDQVKELYLDQNLSIRQVAKQLGCSKVRVKSALDNYQLEKTKEQRDEGRADKYRASIKLNHPTVTIPKIDITKIDYSLDHFDKMTQEISDFLSSNKVLCSTVFTPGYSEYDLENGNKIILYSNIVFKERYIESRQRTQNKLEKENKFAYFIFEYEWYSPRKEKIINQLKNLLKLNKRSIGARKCEIRNISAPQVRSFLIENHLQGADVSSIKLGLFYEEELVAVMTFAKPRFNNKFQWELSRFAAKADCNISGGASKLFNYFLEIYCPENIISYSDMTKTRGNLYAQLGFKLDHTSSPNYVWCNGENAYPRYKCQRHKLVKQFPDLEGCSETGIMIQLGFWKIEDAGNKVWYYGEPW